jgi:hypothetical protein
VFFCISGWLERRLQAGMIFYFLPVWNCFRRFPATSNKKPEALHQEKKLNQGHASRFIGKRYSRTRLRCNFRIEIWCFLNIRERHKSPFHQMSQEHP